MKTKFNYARSLRVAGLLTMIAAASVVQACSSDTIVAAPASATRPSVPSVPSAPQSTQLRVSGTVTDDEGLPVAGVKVMVFRSTTSGSPSSAVTDSKGHYSISLLSADLISALTEKQGYESKWHTRSTSGAADVQFDLRIHRTRQ